MAALMAGAPDVAQEAPLSLEANQLVQAMVDSPAAYIIIFTQVSLSSMHTRLHHYLHPSEGVSMHTKSLHCTLQTVASCTIGYAS